MLLLCAVEAHKSIMFNDINPPNKKRKLFLPLKSNADVVIFH